MVNSSTEETKRHSEEKTAFLRSSIARSPLTEESRCYRAHSLIALKTVQTPLFAKCACAVRTIFALTFQIS